MEPRDTPDLADGLSRPLVRIGLLGHRHGQLLELGSQLLLGARRLTLDTPQLTRRFLLRESAAARVAPRCRRPSSASPGSASSSGSSHLAPLRRRRPLGRHVAMRVVAGPRRQNLRPRPPPLARGGRRRATHNFHVRHRA